MKLSQKVGAVECTTVDHTAGCRFMDGRGGCCIAQYAGSGSQDLSKVDKIMLRFRPIAPKPVTGNATSDGASPVNREACTRVVRNKRKHVRRNNYYIGSNKNNNAKNNKRCNRRTEASMKGRVVTLPLLPEAPVRKDHRPTMADLTVRNSGKVPVWLSFENCDGVMKMEQARAAMQQPMGFAGSFVTVECVTDTWLEGEGLGSTDDERRANLSKDTCPGFISNRLGRVTWTNGSYRKMVTLSKSGMDNSKGSEPTRVRLVVKEKVEVAMRALSTYPAFACRVRLQYSCGQERNSLTVPCDVWRMSDGGFAWRLDVEAALSLRLGR